MNIGFDAKRLYNNFTGLGNHNRTTIDILTDYYPENAYFLYTPKVRINDVTSPYLAKEGCRMIQPDGLLRGGLWRTFGIPGTLKANDIDLFHGLSNELPVGIRRSGVPSVVTIHDVAFKTFTDMYHWQDRQIYDLKWRYAVSHADRIIAISECTKKDILRFYDVDENKIDVVYQPVSPRYYLTRDNSADDAILQELATTYPAVFGSKTASQEYILYVGSINSRKNLLGIVKAMELLPRDMRLPLVVVGDGRGYKAEVQAYMSGREIERYVAFQTCRVSQNALQYLYSHTRCFVYPSFYEGFGLPVVEALLSKCPVVTSNVSSLPEAGGPFALQSDPASVEDIAGKMQLAIGDDAKRQEMIRGGYDYAMQTFHPKVLAERLVDVYHKTCR